MEAKPLYFAMRIMHDVQHWKQERSQTGTGRDRMGSSSSPTQVQVVVDPYAYLDDRLRRHGKQHPRQSVLIRHVEEPVVTAPHRQAARPHPRRDAFYLE